MSTHNICFRGETRKIAVYTVLLKYLELYICLCGEIIKILRLLSPEIYVVGSQCNSIAELSQMRSHNMFLKKILCTLNIWISCFLCTSKI